MTTTQYYGASNVTEVVNEIETADTSGLMEFVGTFYVHGFIGLACTLLLCMICCIFLTHKKRKERSHSEPLLHEHTEQSTSDQVFIFIRDKRSNGRSKGHLTDSSVSYTDTMTTSGMTGVQAHYIDIGTRRSYTSKGPGERGQFHKKTESQSKSMGTIPRNFSNDEESDEVQWGFFLDDISFGMVGDNRSRDAGRSTVDYAQIPQIDSTTPKPPEDSSDSETAGGLVHFSKVITTPRGKRKPGDLNFPTKKQNQNNNHSFIPKRNHARISLRITKKSDLMNDQNKIFVSVASSVTSSPARERRSMLDTPSKLLPTNETSPRKMSYSKGYEKEKQQLIEFDLADDGNAFIINQMNDNYVLWQIKHAVRTDIRTPAQVATFIRKMVTAMGFLESILESVTIHSRKCAGGENSDLTPTHVIQSLMKRAAESNKVQVLVDVSRYRHIDFESIPEYDEEDVEKMVQVYAWLRNNMCTADITDENDAKSALTGMRDVLQEMMDILIRIEEMKQHGRLC